MNINIRRVKSDPSTWENRQPPLDCDRCGKGMNAAYPQGDGTFICYPCNAGRTR
jgi:formylmethanofuran dehydrogenase subunit E